MNPIRLSVGRPMCPAWSSIGNSMNSPQRIQPSSGVTLPSNFIGKLRQIPPNSASTTSISPMDQCPSNGWKEHPPIFATISQTGISRTDMETVLRTTGKFIDFSTTSTHRKNLFCHFHQNSCNSLPLFKSGNKQCGFVY